MYLYAQTYVTGPEKIGLIYVKITPIYIMVSSYCSKLYNICKLDWYPACIGILHV